MRARSLVATTAVLAGLVTALVAVAPSIRFAYRSPSVHLVLETTSALVAAFCAYLVYGRFRDRARLGDLTLGCALLLFASSSLVRAPLSGAGRPLGDFPLWCSLVSSLFAAALLAASPLLPERRLPKRARSLSFAFALCGGVLCVSAAVGIALDGSVDPGVPAALTPGRAGQPFVTGHPAILGAQALGTLLFALAASGFTVRAERTDDDFMRALAVGSVLGAFARINYFLFPSIYSSWVYTGDFFRLGFYLLLLVGAAREIQGYWQRLAHAAVLDERRRIARELHDGLAQELAFIVAESDGQTARAAERALDESRRAIAALTRPADEPFCAALVQATEEVARRVGTRVRFDVDEQLDLDALARESLIRIVREAVANAGRHGNAGRVSVELARGDGLRLRVMDDGRGFDPGSADGGFGLSGMRERAEALGGRLTIWSRPGSGTELEVVLP